MRRHRRERQFDTRMSFRELCNRAGINVKQRIVMYRYMKSKMKEGEHTR
jgi:hypothetical protein